MLSMLKIKIKMNKDNKKNEKGLLDKVKDTTKNTVDYVKSGEMVKDTKEKLGQAKEKVQSGYDYTKQKVGQGVGVVKDGANKLGEKVKQGYNKVT